jgi:FkbM family methyltransferase
MGIRPAPLGAVLKRLLFVKRCEASTEEGLFWLDPASYLGLRVLETGFYEPEMISTVKRFLSAGGTFVDVGANEGYFTVVGSKRVGPNGQVVAVEPQLRLQAVLERNLALNGCKNVVLEPVAVSDKLGHAVLHLAPGVNNSASSLIRPTRYVLARETVSCATLEEIFDRCKIEVCDLLKIDIEGWEYEAVLGSPALFRDRRVKAVALELHPNLLARRGLDGGKIESFLVECGYRIQPDWPTLVWVQS